jgi:hypothetical protein
MRIISDFRDYYDCLQGLDEDKKTLWIRKPLKEEHSWRFTGWNHYTGDAPHVLEHMIGFCNGLYPLFSIWTPYVPETNPVLVRCYTLAQVDAFIRKYYRKDAVEQYMAAPLYGRKRIGIRSRVEFEHFFKGWELHKAECEKHYAPVFEKQRTAVFVIECQGGYGRGTTIEYNACLREYQFARIFDPASAYQEISMFMSNLAVPIKPIPKLDDVTMAEIKGFDKFSFRKDPVKKKR